MARKNEQSLSTCLRSVHPSLMKHIALRTPYNMERIRMTNELRTGLENIALSIFTDCTNVGAPLQTALLAVYLSGLHAGREITLEEKGAGD